jgi:hypothetical protein
MMLALAAPLAASGAWRAATAGRHTLVRAAVERQLRASAWGGATLGYAALSVAGDGSIVLRDLWVDAGRDGTWRAASVRLRTSSCWPGKGAFELEAHDVSIVVGTPRPGLVSCRDRVGR